MAGQNINVLYLILLKLTYLYLEGKKRKEAEDILGARHSVLSLFSSPLPTPAFAGGVGIIAYSIESSISAKY